MDCTLMWPPEPLEVAQEHNPLGPLQIMKNLGHGFMRFSDTTEEPQSGFKDNFKQPQLGRRSLSTERKSCLKVSSMQPVPVERWTAGKLHLGKQLRAVFNLHQCFHNLGNF